MGRRRYLPWLACGCAAAIGIPALAWSAPSTPTSAAPPTGSVIAFDDGFYDGSGTNQSDNAVNVAVGGVVTFSYPTGGSVHNVVFDGALSPASCTQTAGVVFPGTPPPLPTFPGPSG